MNKRIRELVVQAGFFVLSDDKIYIPTTSEEITDCQTKFAELIIHECAIAMSKIPGGYSAEKYYESNKSIKQHFGVE